jgi:hypothetical protein
MVSLIWRILLYHAVKIDSVVKFSFVLLLKEQFYEIMYTFTASCGGPLYGIADRQETWKSVFTSRAPPFEKS